MSNYQENGDNLKSEKENVRWKLDKTKLSKLDKQVLEMVKFPEELNYKQCAQKRIRKQEHNDTYVAKSSLNIDDLVYLTIPKSVALYQINQDIPGGSTDEERKESAKRINKIHQTRSIMHLYIDGHYMDDELAWVLKKFSSPNPTPSMIESFAVEKIEAPVIEKSKGKPKATLDDREKAKAGQLALEGSSAAEIAKELGKPKVTVVNYLKSLPKT